MFAKLNHLAIVSENYAMSGRFYEALGLKDGEPVPAHLQPHIAAGLQNPGSMMVGTPSPTQGRGFFWFYFMNEHFLRYIGKRYPVDYDTVPLGLFLVLHLAWLLLRSLPQGLHPV